MNHKEKMLHEYQGLTKRMVELQNMLTKNANGELEFELTYPVELLERQLSVMKEYMEILEERAKIEGIRLSFKMKEE